MTRESLDRYNDLNRQLDIIMRTPGWAPEIEKESQSVMFQLRLSGCDHAWPEGRSAVGDSVNGSIDECAICGRVIP